MHIASGVQAIAAGFIILATLAAAVVTVRGASSKEQMKAAEAQLESLRGDRDDQAARIERLSNELKDLRLELVGERSAREILQRHVTGRDLMEELKREVGSYHADVMKGVVRVETTMGQAVDVLQQINGKFAA